MVFFQVHGIWKPENFFKVLPSKDGVYLCMEGDFQEMKWIVLKLAYGEQRKFGETFLFSRFIIKHLLVISDHFSVSFSLKEPLLLISVNICIHVYWEIIQIVYWKLSLDIRLSIDKSSIEKIIKGLYSYCKPINDILCTLGKKQNLQCMS